MTKILYVIHDSDSYEVVVDTDTGTLLEVWRYRNNRPGKPEITQFRWLDDQLKDKIEHRLIKEFGEPHNGTS